MTATLATATPALSDAYRFAPSKKTVEILAGMAKTLPKLCVRSYGQWIGIRQGMACITNGFAMLVHYSADYQGVDTCLDRNLFPNGSKFPGFEQVMQAKGVPVDGEALLAFSELKGKALGKSIFLAVTPERGTVELVRGAKKREGTVYLNPAMVAEYLKAIPKGYAITGAFLHMEHEQLRLEFSENGREDVPAFTIIVVGIRPND